MYKVFIRTKTDTAEHVNRTPRQVEEIVRRAGVGEPEHIRKVLEAVRPTLLVIPITGGDRSVINVIRQNQ